MANTNELQQLIRIAYLLENGSDEQDVTYLNPNYSGTINSANVAQDLATADPKRDRLTIQNIDTESLLFSIAADAKIGSSIVLDPGGIATLEQGEADKRISVRSAKTGLSFVAWGRVKQ